MTKKSIQIRDVSFAYDEHKIYEGFSVDIENNDIFFFMGINGCGKTTLLKLVNALLTPQSGDIFVNGKRIKKYDSKSLARVMAYVPQIIHLNSDFLVKDYLALGRTPYKNFYSSLSLDDYKIVEKYSKELGIENLLDTDFNSLSGGQKQNVAICRALVQETSIIVLDEPMSALDMGKQADFLALILRLQAAGKTIVLTSHNPNHVLAIKDKCRVCLLDDGKILGLGRYQDVLSEANIDRIYGDKVVVDKDNKVIMFNV